MIDDVMDVDYSTKEMHKEDCVLYSERYRIDNSRMTSGMILSAKEYEDFRRKIYSTPLP